MIEAIGIVIKDQNMKKPWTPIVVYGTKEGKFKYRTTIPVKKKNRDGLITEDTHHSLSFPSVEEAVGSACRFIKKTWEVDLDALPDEAYGFEKLNVSERVVSKISPKVAAKLKGFLSTLGEEEPEEQSHQQAELVDAESEEESEDPNDIL